SVYEHDAIVGTPQNELSSLLSNFFVPCPG
ncbi:unnamed protein product, partial [marine sediment metagenome]